MERAVSKTSVRWCRNSVLAAWAFCVPCQVRAACSFPQEDNTKTIRYRLERIDASLTVSLEFPNLNTVDCTESKVAFGTIYTFELPDTSAAQLNVTNLNGDTVQTVRLTGSLDLKVTSTYAAFLFYRLKWNKTLADQDLIKAELWNKGTLMISPAIEISDQGASRRLPVDVVAW